MRQNVEIAEKFKKPSLQEQLFIEAILEGKNKTQSAIAAKYSPKSAHNQGKNIYKRPHIRHAIDTYLAENAYSREQIVQKIADMADFNMTEYFKPVTYYISRKVKRPLRLMITDLEAKIDLEDEFMLMVQLDEEERDYTLKQIKSWERQIARYRLELKRNASAFRIVQGPEEEEIRMELDLNMLVADKKKGLIKEIKYTEHGVQVKGPDPQVARQELGKITGAYEIDNKQKAPVMATQINIQIVQPLDDDDD